jgi:cyclopropane fatty-acyl-phospholipid synthase-like methyltransferase
MKKDHYSMPNPLGPHRSEYSGTYFVNDKQNQEELQRLTIQDRMITTAMGGVLSEQTDPSTFRRVLDIGCGPGGWAIETARTYPTMQQPNFCVTWNLLSAWGIRA